MAAATLAVLLSTLAGGWPFLPFPASAAPRLWIAEVVTIALWVGLAVASRARRDAGAWLDVTTVVLYAVTLAAFTLLDGPFSAPGWIAYLGGSVVGYVVFPRRLAL